MMIGTTLPNGATVKAYAELEAGAVVLGYNEGSPEGWITWMMRTGDPASTYWGHYFRDYPEAMDDFIQRVRDHV